MVLRPSATSLPQEGQPVISSASIWPQVWQSFIDFPRCCKTPIREGGNCQSEQPDRSGPIGSLQPLRRLVVNCGRAENPLLKNWSGNEINGTTDFEVSNMVFIRDDLTHK